MFRSGSGRRRCLVHCWVGCRSGPGRGSARHTLSSHHTDAPCCQRRTPPTSAWPAAAADTCGPRARNWPAPLRSLKSGTSTHPPSVPIRKGSPQQGCAEHGQAACGIRRVPQRRRIRRESAICGLPVIRSHPSADSRSSPSPPHRALSFLAAQTAWSTCTAPHSPMTRTRPSCRSSTMAPPSTALAFSQVTPRSSPSATTRPSACTAVKTRRRTRPRT